MAQLPSKHPRDESESDSDFKGMPKFKAQRRFASVPTADVTASKEPIVVKNTEKATAWAVGVFTSWIKEQNERSEEKCPVEVLCSGDDAVLCHWLCVFVKEARRVDGTPYTPRSLSQILSGLQRFMNSRISPTKPKVKLTDASSANFKELHNVLETLYRELHSQGVGAFRKQAEVISRDEESLLWERGAIGVHSPLALLNMQGCTFNFCFKK